MRIAVRVGYVGAIGLGITALVTGNFMLGGIALFGGITCWITHKQLQYTQETMGFESDDYAASLHAEAEDDPPPRPSRRAEQRRRREQQESEAVDAILRKIAATGMESLSASEKRMLRRATKKKQESGRA